MNKMYRQELSGRITGIRVGCSSDAECVISWDIIFNNIRKFIFVDLRAIIEVV